MWFWGYELNKYLIVSEEFETEKRMHISAIQLYKTDIQISQLEKFYKEKWEKVQKQK